MTFVELFEAIQSGDVRRVRKVLTTGANANAQGPSLRTPLTLASLLGFTDVIRALLESGARADLHDAAGQTALMLAARNDHAESVRVLLEAGADPSVTDASGYSVRWYSMHRDVNFSLPLFRGLHGTFIIRRLRKTASARLIDQEIRSNRRRLR